MSLISDLNTVMNADSSLNTNMTGGIYYENLPDNFDLTKKWIVYTLTATSQVNCLNSKNAYQTYDLNCLIICPDTTDVETNSIILTDYLNDKSSGSINDIMFTSDERNFDLEKNIYMNNLTFNLLK